MKNLQLLLGIVTIIGSHIAVVFAPILGLGDEMKVVIPSAIVLLFLLYLLITRKARVNTKESVFQQFGAYMRNTSTDDITKSKYRDDEPEQANILVLTVEGSNQEEIGKVKSEFDKADERYGINIVRVEHFIFKPSLIDSEINRLKDKLNKLDLDALLVHRSTESEKLPELYEAVDRWGHENSGVPCLIIEEDIAEGDKSSPYLLSEYRHHGINDIPLKSIPWNLLSRAKSRSSSWFVQARFNRKMSLAIFGIFIGTFILALFWYKKTNDRVLKVKGDTIIHKLAAREEIWNEDTYNKFIWYNAQYATAITGHRKSHFELIKAGVKFRLILVQPPRVYQSDFEKFVLKFRDMRKLVERINKQLIDSKSPLNINQVFPEIIVIRNDEPANISFFLTDSEKDGSKQRAIIYLEDEQFMDQRIPELSIETNNKAVLEKLMLKYSSAQSNQNKENITASDLLDSGKVDDSFYVNEEP